MRVAHGRARPITLAVLGMAVYAAACRPEPSRASGSLTARRGAPPSAGGEVDLAADDGQWVRPSKDSQGTRFSALHEIDTSNVARLRVVATFSTGTTKGLEAAPIVAGTTMYIVTPLPNEVYALDLTKPGLPVKWSYDPEPALAAQGVACCDVVNRGAVYDNGKLFFNTPRDHTVTRPLHAFLLQLVPIWGWHVPALFDAAVVSDPVHALEHVSFLGGALVFWWSVLRAPEGAARGASIIYLFLTAVGTSVLGALMTFTRAPWYAPYGTPSAFIGLSPLADQQLGGLVMWIPASVPYLAAALFAARRLLRAPAPAVS